MKVERGKRLVSMLLDHLIMGFIAALFLIPSTIKSVSDMESAETQLDFGLSYPYLIITGLSLYFCKDSINGRSIAKRLMGFQVVNHKTNIPASPLRCLV